MLHIDEGDVAAVLLTLGDAVQREGGFARALGSVDLDDPAARQTADPKGDVKAQGAGGYMTDVHMRVLTELHDSSLAELLFDLGERSFQRFVFIYSHSEFSFDFCFFRQYYIICSIK